MSSSLPSTSRRHVLGAAAWSVPVIAVAVATPAHAASAEPPTISLTVHAGSTDGWVNAAISRAIVIDTYSGMRITNNDVVSLPVGTLVTTEVDNRIYGPPSDSFLSLVSSATSGTTLTSIFATTREVAPGTSESFQFNTPFLPVIIDGVGEVFENVVPRTFSIAAQGDASVSSEAVYSDIAPYEPQVSSTWATHDVVTDAGLYSVSYADVVTIANPGPGPLPAGLTFGVMGGDVVNSIAIASVTVAGASVATDSVFTSAGSGGSSGWWRTASDIPAGSTVVANLTTDVKDNAPTGYTNIARVMLQDNLFARPIGNAMQVNAPAPVFSGP